MSHVSAIDSRVFRNLFGIEEARSIFSDEAYIQSMIDVEAALARAQSTIGIIPRQVGEVITAQASVSNINLERLSTETDIVGYPVLPLVRQLTEMVDHESAAYIHWGATTQDIMDSASMLQVKKGLDLVRGLLIELICTLKKLSVEHRDTPMAGRTHLQHALPVTFGYKCAVYLSGFQRHLQRLDQIKERCLLVSFGGAAGTLASLGSDDTGLRVRKQLAVELGLKDSAISWHVARDHVAEVISFLALIGGSLGKIALDIIFMSSNELGEVSEPFVPHRGASSTMPQKRNPISSEVVLAASKILRSDASLALDAMVSDFERASGPWHLEWVALPNSFVIACGALHQTNFALAGLVVNVDAMLDNLNSTRGLIVAEAVMMGMAPFTGRQAAHDIVYAACKMSIETNKPLFDVLIEDPSVHEKIELKKLADLCNPLNYLGCSRLMVDDVVASDSTIKSLSSGIYNNTDNTMNGVLNGKLDALKNGYTNGHSNGILNGSTNGGH
ncbi:3-carboxy-cis,cis-muconate cycloisomerase [Bisporella sp. PMI_857]|nr:3-carboxy-cis,cis-muconate cycloisomerase [Bisporella sp. PMI_857]